MLEEQVLVPCQAPILEDFHHTLSSHPLLRHDLHNFVLGYESNALIIPHLLQLTLLTLEVKFETLLSIFQITKVFMTTQ